MINGDEKIQIEVWMQKVEWIYVIFVIDAALSYLNMSHCDNQ